MKKEDLLKYVEGKGYSLTEEVRNAAEELAEILEAEGETDIAHVLAWLEEKRANLSAKVTPIPIKELDKWKTDPETGNISHDSGRFFSVIGVKIEGATESPQQNWTQPIVWQEECGILGVLRQRKGGVMRYLLWAKFEPGSIANPQLSPTVQATASNLAQVHGGAKPRFAEYFENGGKGTTVVSVVHVEDPSRFYRKTNRCVVVEVPEEEEIEITDSFIWLTLPQIKKLLRVDLAVNALARDVFGSL